jgi:hypothetical protein
VQVAHLAAGGHATVTNRKLFKATLPTGIIHRKIAALRWRNKRDTAVIGDIRTDDKKKHNYHGRHNSMYATKQTISAEC